MERNQPVSECGLLSAVSNPNETKHSCRSPASTQPSQSDVTTDVVVELRLRLKKLNGASAIFFGSLSGLSGDGGPPGPGVLREAMVPVGAGSDRAGLWGGPESSGEVRTGEFGDDGGV